MTRLHRNLFSRLLVFALVSDFLLFGLGLGLILCRAQVAVFGRDWHHWQWGTLQCSPRAGMGNFFDRLAHITYLLPRPGNDPEVVKVGPEIQSFCVILLILVLAQVLLFIRQYRKGRDRHNKILETPLSAMAEQADLLSKVHLQERKYHQLEEVIEAMPAGRPEARLNVHDKDLQGIADAFNKLLDQIYASYEQQTRFVSDASHELRTPIAVIQGYIEMLERWGSEDPAVLKESITAIRDEVKQMQVLVEQLLFLARGDAGRNPMTLEKVNLVDILADIKEDYSILDPQRPYLFLSDGPVYVLADVQMMITMVRILVNNARRYSPPEAAITLHVFTEASGEPCLAVEDQGQGITAEELPHIFERFYRSDPARQKAGGGSGLGLAIADLIMKNHGGYFKVVSSPDIGSRFLAVFPPYQEPNPTPNT